MARVLISMIMKIFGYNVKIVTKDFDNTWFSVLPNFEIQHKHWMSYLVWFSLWKWHFVLQLTNATWEANLFNENEE